MQAECADRFLAGGAHPGKCFCVGPIDIIREGSYNVISAAAAARMGDKTMHGGVIVTGMFNVLIGTKTDKASVPGGGAGGRQCHEQAVPDKGRQGREAVYQGLTLMVGTPDFSNPLLDALRQLPGEIFAVVEGAHFDDAPAELKKCGLAGRPLYLEGESDHDVASGPHLLPSEISGRWRRSAS